MSRSPPHPPSKVLRRRADLRLSKIDHLNGRQLFAVFEGQAAIGVFPSVDIAERFFKLRHQHLMKESDFVTSFAVGKAAQTLTN